MTVQPHSSAHLVLSAIRSMMIAEVIAQPAAVMITVRRDMFTLLAAAISEVLDTIALLEESAAAGDRLGRELRISKAEITRLELQLTARDLDRISRPRLSVVRGSADVVDLSEVLEREVRGASRPLSPEGGAA